MPDLSFQITGAEAASRSMTPLLQFRLEITNASEASPVQALILNAQIQIQPAQRTYNEHEKEQLEDLFGKPDRWGQTVRNRLWAHVNLTVGAFANATEVTVPVPCTYDLNIATAKYFHALEEGEVSVLFLFSGSLFYTGADGRLQVDRISWDKECAYRMPVRVWRDMMDQHYPNSAWLYLRRDVFDQLNEFKQRNGCATWDQTVERLLSSDVPDEVTA